MKTPPSRSVPMEVIVLGFCRTGTASMRAALTILGYGSPHHIGRLMSDPRQMDAWTAAIDAKYQKEERVDREYLDSLLGDFRAVADVPGILFAEELIQAYPDARIVLTTRDPDRWWPSFSTTLLPMLDTNHTRLARWLDLRGFGQFIPFARRCLEIVLGLAPLDTIDAETAKRRYMGYCNKIRRLAPPERLLEYEVGEGWGRLCAFLGKDVPDVAFPHRNDGQSILDGSRRHISQIYRNAVGGALIIGSILIPLLLAVYERLSWD